MLESQPVETAIGLILMFFVIALSASSLVEIISQVFRLRAKDLETAIGQMLLGDGVTLPTKSLQLTDEERKHLENGDGVLGAELTKDQQKALKKRFPLKYDPKKAIENAVMTFKGTSVYEAAAAGARRGAKRGKPSYLAARSFADGVGEMLSDVDGQLSSVHWDGLPDGLKRRLTALGQCVGAVTQDAKQEALAVRSGLEQWFDDTMARAEGAYKRWTKWWIFGIGLIIAVAANASTFHVAERLWHDPATRSAVVSAASQVGTDNEPADITSVAAATDKLTELQLPVGWDDESKEAWDDLPGALFDSAQPLTMLLGWLVTGFLVTLGAPFWFTLLTKLASLRSTGAKPPPASNDDASATSLQKDLTAGATTASPILPVIEADDVTAMFAVDPSQLRRARIVEDSPASVPRVRIAQAFGLRAE